MEFQLLTNLEKDLPREITFNFEAQKAWLEERLSYYNGLIVTEDTIKDAKADRAKLNKLKDAIETRRKEIKKEWLVPYTAFETKVKELTSLIDQPVGAIDSQLKSYEERRKQEKQEKVEKAYEQIVPEPLREIIPLEKVANPKWLNATTQMKSVEEDLAALVKRTNADMLALDTIEPEYAAAVRETYIRTLDIELALSKKQALQEAAEAFRQREEAKAKAEAEKPAEPILEPVAPQEAPPEQTESIYALRLELYVTKDQAKKLKTFLTENGINHIKI